MPPPATPQHDYIALAELPHAMGRRPGGAHDEEAGEGDSDYDGGLLRETELRLGPPGSGTPRRKEKPPLALELLLPLHKGLASGAKRGFLEAIDGSGRWVFPGGGVGEGDAAKGAGLFSPRGDGAGRQLGGVNQDGGTAASGVAPEKKGQASTEGNDRGGMAPSPKAQVVGWPPIRSYRKNTMAANPTKKGDDAEKQDSSCLYVKVSMDGAPYLRKIDLKIYSNYKELSTALEKMFSCFTLGQYGSHGMPKRDGLGENKLNDLHRSEYVLTYEDKDGDWMLVGDVPWEMFMGSCRRLRIMKGSDAIGLAPRSTDKSKNRN